MTVFAPMLPVLLAGLASTDCVTLAIDDEALAVRVKDELEAVVQLPVVEAGCATVVAIDGARRLTVTASAVTPPVVFDEVLAGNSAVATATHVAEVVRGVLLEVEERQRPPPPPPVVITPPAPRPAPEPRFEARLGGGALFAEGGLSVAGLVELQAALRVGRLAFGLGGLGSVTPSSRAVPEGRLLARPFAAWAFTSLRVALSERWSLTPCISAGAFVVPLEGDAVSPFSGARAVGFSAALGLEVRTAYAFTRWLGVWASVQAQFLLQPLRLDVSGARASMVGPLLAAPCAGLEVRW